jgi:tRNA dimethylallyltransferase
LEGKPPLLVVAGPTASGKTALSVSLCGKLDGEVVCADSMQVYRGMEIATAKPSPEQLRAAPHHLLGFADPAGRFSVAQYAPLAHAAIADIRARGKLPVLCGGTGLYIQAVTEGLALTPGFAPGRAVEADWQALAEIDPAAAAKIHFNDKKRITHALELYHATGVTLTEQNQRSRPEERPYRAKMLFLRARERQYLYERIDERVDRMLARGLLEEARAERQRGKGTAAQAIGYKELEPFFAGGCSLENAVERLKRETRRYAKRQLSWFGRMAREWNEREPGSCVGLFMDDDDILEKAIKGLDS